MSTEVAVDLRARLHAALDSFLEAKSATVTAIDAGLRPVMDAIREFVDGGKRLRPAFCYWGWRGAGGADGDEIVAAAASLELLQAAALIHDDFMDASDTRRGRPAIHRRFTELHRERGWHGSGTGFGAAAAIIIGDLCLAWCDEMFETSGVPGLARARPTFHAMRTEVMAGQYLDVLAQAMGVPDVGRSLRVMEYKAAKYTVERPLHIGGLLADAPAGLMAAYSAYGLAIGEAFQLRDDMLGVFGDPAKTGKPAGDDLREGKQTLLVALAHERAADRDRALLERAIGDAAMDEHGVAALRDVLARTGAVDAVEARIERLTERAVRALDGAPVEPVARAALLELALAASDRSA